VDKAWRENGKRQTEKEENWKGKRCEALEDELLSVKSQLGNLTAATFALRFRPCDLLETHV